MGPEQNTIILPKIRATKRKVVDISKRKRSLFSCDRCKTKKIACHRLGKNGLEQNTNVPCAMCQVLNLDCKTTIRRKKRTHGPILHVGLHYKCLLLIMTALFPQKDVNNIDILIEIGESMSLKMPSRDTGELSEEEELRDISIRLTSARKQKDVDQMDMTTIEDTMSPTGQLKSPLGSIRSSSFATAPEPPENYEMVYTGKPISGFGSTTSPSNSKSQYDRVIFDVGGISHYIGPFGQPALLTTLVNIALKRTRRNKLNSIDYVTNRNKNGSCISFCQEQMSPKTFSELNLQEYPLANLIDKDEADMYIDVFFQEFSSLVLCFDEFTFRQNHTIFWQMLQGDNSRRLSNAQVCCIYAVWLLANNHIMSQDDTYKLCSMVSKKYLDIIKLTLPDILLSPSLDGIRCLLLLALYFDCNMERETGYILCELATRQALSCGFHRQSLMSSRMVEEAEEIGRTWWFICHMEIRYCIDMGRSSTIKLGEVNVQYPKLLNSSEISRRYFHLIADLNKIAFDLLNLRKDLFSSSGLVSKESIGKAQIISHRFQQFFSEISNEFKDNCSTEQYSYILISFHYYVISFSMPFLLYLANNLDTIISNEEPILAITMQSLKSATDVAYVLRATEEAGNLNLSLSADIYCAFYAMMTLMAGSVLFETVKLRKIRKSIDLNYIELNYRISLPTIYQAASEIRALNARNLDKQKGTSQIISDWVEVIGKDLDLVRESAKKRSDKENMRERARKQLAVSDMVVDDKLREGSSSTIGFAEDASQVTTLSDISDTSTQDEFLQEQGSWDDTSPLFTGANFFTDAFSSSNDPLLMENEMLDILFGSIRYQRV